MEKFLKLISVILVVALFVSCLSGCGDKRQDEIIYLTVTEKPKTLDPQTAETETELMIIRNSFEGLTRIDENGDTALSGAEGYTKKGNKYTFKLRNNAKWSDGSFVTAYDYEFAYSRVIDPNTSSPFYDTLVNNINDIYATDKNTVVVIALTNDEDTVFEMLANSALMPCNEKFFNQAEGKYGLNINTIISNGSYLVSKWHAEDDFGIRLKRFNEYNGNFKAKNAAVYISMPEKDYSAYKTLKEGKCDIAFIGSADINTAKKENFKTITFENTCWFLTMSNELNVNTKKAFKMLITESVYKDNLNDCLKTATSMFPQIYNNKNKPIVNELFTYSPDIGKNLMTSSLKAYENDKLPQIKLYYPTSSITEPIIKNIAGHWQNNLGAYINIEPVEHTEYLIDELINPTYQMALVPVKDSGNNLSNYLKNFGYLYTGQSLEEIQSDILKSGNVYPLLFEKTAIAYSSTLKNVTSTKLNGYIDFSFVIKVS